MTTSSRERLRETLHFSPLISLPLFAALLGVLLLQNGVLRDGNDKLRSEVAALHGQVVEVRKRVDNIDARVGAPSFGRRSTTAKRTTDAGRSKTTKTKAKASKPRSADARSASAKPDGARRPTAGKAGKGGKSKRGKRKAKRGNGP